MVESSGSDDIWLDPSKPLSQAEFINRLILLMQSARNSKFTLCCFLVARGIAYADGYSMTDMAKHWGVCKATVSKHCREICAYFNLRPRYTDEEAQQTFRETNVRPVKIRD